MAKTVYTSSRLAPRDPADVDYGPETADWIIYVVAVTALIVCFVFLAVAYARPTVAGSDVESPRCWEGEALVPQGPDGQLRCVAIDDLAGRP